MVFRIEQAGRAGRRENPLRLDPHPPDLFRRGASLQSTADGIDAIELINGGQMTYQSDSFTFQPMPVTGQKNIDAR